MIKSLRDTYCQHVERSEFQSKSQKKAYGQVKGNVRLQIA